MESVNVVSPARDRSCVDKQHSMGNRIVFRDTDNQKPFIPTSTADALTGILLIPDMSLPHCDWSFLPCPPTPRRVWIANSLAFLLSLQAQPSHHPCDVYAAVDESFIRPLTAGCTKPYAMTAASRRPSHRPEPCFTRTSSELKLILTSQCAPTKVLVSMCYYAGLTERQSR
jgi:hypothetical protein